MKINYLENGDLAIFNGYKFRRDKKTGYYLNSNIHKRLHVYVWEYYNGKVPKGYQVHHIDHDKSNNDINNLKLLSAGEHSKLHSSELTLEEQERRRKNFEEKARPKAIEWHKSEEAKGWHKKHYEQMKDKLNKKEVKVCKCCGKKYIGKPSSKFCSDKCRAKYRRDRGIDNEIRICEYCGEKFSINKYSKTKTCGRSCSNKLMWQKRKEGYNV